jgi:hypothetical protein
LFLRAGRARRAKSPPHDNAVEAQVETDLQPR